jgi:predicted Ser/Thr protein kinase
LEEKKQILYLLEPVGGGKSSIAERVKQLMAIKGSPVNESPLDGWSRPRTARCWTLLEKEYGIPTRYLQRILRPPGKRLEEHGGDIRKFKVVKRYPSVLKQIGHPEDGRDAALSVTGNSARPVSTGVLRLRNFARSPEVCVSIERQPCCARHVVC